MSPLCDTPTYVCRAILSCDSHVTHLFSLQYELDEELLQLFIAVVDAELFKAACKRNGNEYNYTSRI